MTCPIILEDLAKWGIRSDAFELSELDESDMEQAWDEVEGYLRSSPSITLPLTVEQITLTLKQKACVLMTWNIMCVQGFDPTNNAQDAVIRLRYEDAIAWFGKVASGKINPIPTPPETPSTDDDDDTDESGGVVISEASRGWSTTYL